MGKLFGTDGIRGVANKELSVDLAMEVAQAAGTVIKEKTGHKPRFVIGRDTRLSSSMLESAMAAGLCSVGCDVQLLGVVPTPAVAYLVRKMGADAGIMLTASHNPFMDNGIKIISGTGFKLSDEEEEEIEAIIIDNERVPQKAPPEEIGMVTAAFNAVDRYVDYLVSLGEGPFSGMKVALDCANGCASVTAPKIFERLGAECHLLHAEPNGLNVNQNCGSTHIGGLQEYVKAHGCDLGFAFDGDADRCLAVDRNGDLVDGDVLMAIFALDLKKRGKLKNNGLVVTVMSNLGLFHFAKEHDIATPTTKVGDRYVLETIIRDGYSLGGEQSGHIIFFDDMTTGDGQLSAVHLLGILAREKKPLHELHRIMTTYPQVLKNVRADDELKASLWELDDLFKEMDDRLGDQGRVLVRPSGTEPLVRVMVEGADYAQIEEIAGLIAAAIEARQN